MNLQYVILCSDGTSYAVDNQTAAMQYGTPKQLRFDLGKLLSSGWIPLRESPMGGGDTLAYSLIVLERPQP